MNFLHLMIGEAVTAMTYYSLGHGFGSAFMHVSLCFHACTASHVMSCHVILCHVMSSYVMSCHPLTVGRS